MLSIGLFDWIPSGGPSLHAGTLAILPPPHELTLPTKPYRAYGVMVTIPTVGSSRLELSYLTLNDRGSAPAPTDLGLFGGTILQGEPLSMAYSLRHLKASWNYLTYPNPPDAKLRIKTLWEFHYMQIKPTVTATVTAPDQPLAGSQRILLPAVGLGIEYVASKHFRLELRGSGMAFPHRSAIGDAEGNGGRPPGPSRNLRGREIPAFQDFSQERHLYQRHAVGAGRRRAVGIPIAERTL